MNTSRYIQITDWALLEYEYANEKIQTSTTRAFKIENAYNNSIQFVNGDIALNVTNNVLDRASAVHNVIGNKWAYLDSNTIMPTINQDDKLILSEETSNLGSYIEYDIIKIHIVSGFNLDGIDGIISQVSVFDKLGHRLDLANHTFLSSQNDYKFNGNPLFIGDKLYDKYIEFKIPSYNYIQTEFNANTSNPNSFGFRYSHDNVGYEAGTLIDFTLHEITNTNTLNGNQFFVTGEKYNLSFLSADQFGLLGATIKESDSGDYFEYYGTWDDGLLEDYILRLNSMGGNWAVVHQLEIYEQIGPNNILTYNMTTIQENNFDKPNIFRPVINNSDIAFSFSIDYTMRFMNRNDGDQIIRRSSLTSYEPKKYGKSISRITVSDGYRPMKVYNKIVSGEEKSSSLSYVQNNMSAFKSIVNTKYVPHYYNNTNIALTTVGQSSQELDDNIWGQGKAIILLNKFDNKIRFKLYDRSDSDHEFEHMDLSTGGNILLSFILDNDTKIYIEQSPNTNTDPTAGEVEFDIDSDTSTKLLNQNNMKFYIISKGGEFDNETVLYQGSYDNFDNREDVMNRLYSEQLSELDKKIKKLQSESERLRRQEESIKNKLEKESALLTEIKTEQERLSNMKDLSDENAILRDENERYILQLAKDSRKIDKQRADLLKQLSNMQDKETKQNANFKFREVPGREVDISASFKSVMPKVSTPSIPGTSLNKTIKKK